jgi:hypothetical protein
MHPMRCPAAALTRRRHRCLRSAASWQRRARARACATDPAAARKSCAAWHARTPLRARESGTAARGGLPAQQRSARVLRCAHRKPLVTHLRATRCAPPRTPPSGLARRAL